MNHRTCQSSLRLLARALAAAVVSALLCVFPAPAEAAAPAKTAPSGPVSYYKQIRPVFQANCHGCHQPAKDKGGYVMTEFEKLLAAGDSGDKPVVPGKPADSYLLKQITPVNGEAEMPQNKPPLHSTEIELVSRWIAEGASDDTPANAKERYDLDHPPVYTRPPIVTSIDFSPDGKWIAVAGFHEVLLHHADGSGIAGRLIGISERIQSVRFSPDGSKLAVAGGQPARMGEIQIWDVADRKLSLSVPIGYDTVYGASWSPDGKYVAFGGSDNTARAIEAATGKQVLQQGSHNDWVLDTAFSAKGTHLVSISRDMSAKLTEFATQRFVDNITSITPGALRGGLHAITRHPTKDEILIGGADGVPQIYQIFRQAPRKIGDNAALLRRFPAMEGRIFSVAYSRDGTRIAAASTLNGSSMVNIYDARFDATIPTNILKAYEKTAAGYSKEERQAIETFVTSEITLLHTLAFEGTSIYAVAFSPNGDYLAASGSDGEVSLIHVISGWIDKQFAVAPELQPATAPALAGAAPAAAGSAPADIPAEGLPKGARVVALSLEPEKVTFLKPLEHAQLLVTAKLASGDSVDVTRLASYQVPHDIADVSPLGRLRPKKSAKGTLMAAFGGKRATAELDFTTLQPVLEPEFVSDVNPVLSKLSCNAGTCHGSKDGKNGFKLSLRGYDPIFDVRGFADDHAARRVNFASPDDSLMLLKATGAVPHEGGQRTTTDSVYYAIIRQWIANGAQLTAPARRLERIDIYPKNPIVQQTGARQQMRIIATYHDGHTRDVTAEAFLDSGNTDVASANDAALITTLRRGEAPLLARYEGRYDATTLTVMGDRTGFVWKDPPAFNKIDTLVAAKWKRMKILPSDLCTDYEFARRVHLDLTGLPPTLETLERFVDDKTETQLKRNALVEQLIGSPEFVDHWANKWADLLQVNRKFLGEEGAKLFRDWIRAEIATNAPHNQFVSKILTSSGSNREHPQASYYKILREPAAIMENTTHLFLATRFNCNKCHDHPFERWTQDQYFELAAFFARVDLKKDDASGDRRIGGTAVEGSKPLYEIVADKSSGEVIHERTSMVSPPRFPYVAGETTDAPAETRREKLAAWITSPDNPYFASSHVNRLWGYLMGVGLIEPVDDVRAGNPPTNPDLLEYLTQEFIRSGFDNRHILRLICQSRTYQLSVATHKWNEDDKINYSHALPRRLPAEVLLDTVYAVTGSTPAIPGVKPGTRAAQLPDSGIDLPSGFLANLGRPPRESACECERSNDLTLGTVMTLMSGPTVSGAVNNPENELAALVKREPDNERMIDNVFLRVLNRPAKPQEIKATMSTMEELEKQHLALTQALAQAETKWVHRRRELEQQRAEAIQKAETALSAYLTEQAPKVAAAQRQRQEAIALAEQKVRDYEATLPAKLTAWEDSITSNQFATAWIAVDPAEIRSEGGIKLERAPGGSVRSTGSRGGLPDYIVATETSLKNITGVKLEVLTDDDAPGFGPGLNEGNFFLSEFQVHAAPKTNASNFTLHKIASAATDFIEADLDLKHTFDDKAEQGLREGWAVGGAEGAPHWAAFALEKPIGEPDGTKIRFTLQHRYQAPYEIARFKLWITTSATPTQEGLPKDVIDALNTPAVTRLPEQINTLYAHYRQIDADLRQHQQQLATARKPLPVDERLKELELDLARATKPVLTDSALVQLRLDAEVSERQLAQRRLTTAQDLAWALINTPAFLFNH